MASVCLDQTFKEFGYLIKHITQGSMWELKFSDLTGRSVSWEILEHLGWFWTRKKS